jgi:DNA repair exonuclease SbcCD nuclease subunit
MKDLFLFIGDIHIKFNNLQDVDKLEQVIESRDKPDFIIVAGDVLDTHERLNTQLMIRAYNLFRTLKQIAPLYILVGNHDYINNQQFLTSNHWMNGMKEWPDVHIVDTPTWIRTHSRSYLLMPFVPVGRFLEACSLEAGWQDATCIFAHQEIYGCKMGAVQSINGDRWLSNWPLLISGHIHDRQKLEPNVLYPGSSLNHSYGQDNQGISLFSFDDLHDAHEERIDIGLAKKVIMYKKIKNLDESLVPNELNVKLSLEGEYQEIKSFKKSKTYNELLKNNVKVVFRNTESDLISKPDNPQHNFIHILHNFVLKENDDELLKDLELIK